MTGTQCVLRNSTTPPGRQSSAAGRERVLGAGGLDDDVVLTVGARRCTESLAREPLVLVARHQTDLTCRGARRSDGREPDRARADDSDPGAGRHLGQPEPVDRDTEWLHEARVGRVEPVGTGHELGLVHDDGVGHAPGGAGSPRAR